MTNSTLPPIDDLRARVERLHERRMAEDERLVCMERAAILRASCERHADLPRARRQAAIIRDICEQTTPAFEPEDVIAGRVLEVIPDASGEALYAAHPELFEEDGVPDCLDSMSIFIPDWGWLISAGLGGIAAQVQANLDDADEAGREFLEAALDALGSASMLIRRYADVARRQGLDDIADRCERVAWDAPSTFLDALQLLQIIHLLLSVLIGGRDVTPGRMDQYLLPLYRSDIEQGRITREQAVLVMAMFMLRLTQAAGNDTDFDDNTRRSPCRYSHLYVTVGGCDADGRPADNELSLAILDAVDFLGYKEPTVCVRYRADSALEFRERVAQLVIARQPVTIYNDEVVTRALASQDVPIEHAWDYAHSACHNVLVPGIDAGSGPGFHNLPATLLRALDRADGATFDELMALLGEEMSAGLAAARSAAEWRWENKLGRECPLLHSALLRHSVEQARPCWQSAPISHMNHSAMGLATVVDSLVAIRELVFAADAELSLSQLREALAANWAGHEDTRRQIRTELPRYGRDDEDTRALARTVGEMWVAEVARASEGMDRLAMWPAFYSHIVHVHHGRDTGATPDGRLAGEPLSENQNPSAGTVGCSPTTVLSAMADLPVDRTPSGACTMTLSPRDLTGGLLLSLLESYFQMGGLHMHVTVVDPVMLRAAQAHPEEHRDLMVRVAGFNGYFVRCAPHVQADVLRRYLS